MTVVLAIATATPQVSVAIGGPTGVLGAVHLRQGRRHGETLSPAIASLSNLTGVTIGDIERVAVDTGPGLFTGLRVGVATAKALASALGVPVVAGSSLDLLAHPHRRAGRPVAAVVDARRGQVFWALYEPGPRGMVAVDGPAVAAPDAVCEELRALIDPVLATGDGARRYFGQSGIEIAPDEFDHPSAAVLLELAAGQPGLPAGEITPTYLRDADVRIGWDRI